MRRLRPDARSFADVLDQLEDPAAELEECCRILVPGGTIAIRVRNAVSQLWIYRFFRRIEWLWRLAGIKAPYTFHRYNFSRSAIERLLASKGFVNISVCNSPLTIGDPYQYTSIGAAVRLGKFLAAALSDVAYRLTQGRRVLSPSLLVWARKP